MEREERRGEGTSASQISRDICSVLMVVRFSGSKEFRSSWSFTFAFAIRASRVCARIRVCSHEGSRRPSIHWTRRQKLARTAGLKSFLNPVRRLNSLSNIEGS